MSDAGSIRYLHAQPDGGVVRGGGAEHLCPHQKYGQNKHQAWARELYRSFGLFRPTGTRWVAADSLASVMVSPASMCLTTTPPL
jgi:hypothetical protein